MKVKVGLSDMAAVRDFQAGHPNGDWVCRLLAQVRHCETGLECYMVAAEIGLNSKDFSVSKRRFPSEYEFTGQSDLQLYELNAARRN